MDIDQVRMKILSDIYEMEYKLGKPISENDYQLTEQEPTAKKQEFAWHLKILRGEGVIRFNDNEAFGLGGLTNLKYNSCIGLIRPEEIHITDQGKKRLGIL